MIQPYPDATQVGDLGRPSIPGSVRNAARVMYAGSVVSATHAVVYLVTKSATKTAIENKHPNLSAGTLNTVTNVGVIIGAASALIGALFFVWIARSSRNGKNWARITATVLLAVAVLGNVYNVSNGQATVNLIFALAEGLIGLTAVVLLWLPGSNDWFRFFRRPQL